MNYMGEGNKSSKKSSKKGQSTTAKTPEEAEKIRKKQLSNRQYQK